MEMPVPEADLERLYGLELDEFVAARTATARRLRQDGKREEAAATAKLRKPSVAAWIVNRVAREAPRPLAQLLDAGDRLRAAADGGSAGDLRTAVADEQAALASVMREAGQASAHAGVGSGGTLQRVHETLHAAALDPELADQVRRGVLDREHQAAAFPLGGGPARSAPKRQRKAPPAPKKRDTRAKQAVERAAAALKEAEKSLADAEKALGRAEREVARAERARDAARGRLDRAREKAGSDG
jgi:hypothetical protein